MEERMELDFFGEEIDFLGDGWITPEDHRGRVVTFVVDYSLSARDILPAVAVTCYDLMKECLLGDGRQTWFGFLPYGNGGEQTPVYTDNPSQILEEMLLARVGGGSKNGVEETGRALRLACECMQKITPEGGEALEMAPENRILILFTDSPSEESVNLRRMVRTKAGFADCPPIRAAILFLPMQARANKAHAARYQFSLVDAGGRPDRHLAPYIFPLEELIGSRVLEEDPMSEQWISQLLAVIS